MIKTIRCPSLLYIYIIITFFCGASILSAFGLENDENLIFQIHYFSFPFLILFFIINYKKINFTNKEKTLLIILLVYVVFLKLILSKSANVGILINVFFEPILLVCVLRYLPTKYALRFQKYVIVFLLVEVFIALVESTLQTSFFSSSELIDLRGDFRATSLHGHPLQNAFLVCIISTAIIASNFKLPLKYILFFIGLIGVFAFNTRSSILIMMFMFFFNLLIDFFYKKKSIRSTLLLLFIVLLFSYIGFQIITKYSLGTRLDIEISDTDGSSNARLILPAIVLSQKMSALLFGGVDIVNILDTYSLVAIENSIVILILTFGLILTIIGIVYMFKIISDISTNHRLKYELFFVLFLLLNVNNGLVTICPILPVFIVSLYSFTKEKI